ncbi:unnamed protein product, partial [Brassica rapa subsp. narinosa]
FTDLAYESINWLIVTHSQVFKLGGKMIKTSSSHTSVSLKVIN